MVLTIAERSEFYEFLEGLERTKKNFQGLYFNECREY